MVVNEIIHMTPAERDIIVDVARALQPFEKEIARRWYDLYATTKAIHRARERTERSFRHATWLLITSLGDGNFSAYLKRVQKAGVAFARDKERYENLLIFFRFYEESVSPCLATCFPTRIDCVQRTLEHLHHGIIAIMSRSYFKELGKDREKFLNTLIHDLKNPVVGMTGFAQKMTEKRLPKQKENQLLRIIKESGEKVSCIIEHALAYGSLKSGKAFLNVDKTNVAEVVQEAAVIFLPEIEKKALSITINKQSLVNWDYLSPVEAEVDRDLVLRAVGNYISNAVKHAKKKIGIFIQEHGNDIRISVTDDGPGVPPDKFSLIFEDYYVVPGGKPGIGIGLASVKMIADLHKGKAWVESPYGNGCTFHLMLPRKQGQKHENS